MRTQREVVDNRRRRRRRCATRKDATIQTTRSVGVVVCFAIETTQKILCGEIDPFFCKDGVVLFRVLSLNRQNLKRVLLDDVPPVNVPAVASGQDDCTVEGDFRLTHDGFFRETF